MAKAGKRIRKISDGIDRDPAAAGRLAVRLVQLRVRQRVDDLHVDLVLDGVRVALGGA